jgi:hypothetical protein
VRRVSTPQRSAISPCPRQWQAKADRDLRFSSPLRSGIVALRHRRPLPRRAQAGCGRARRLGEAGRAGSAQQPKAASTARCLHGAGQHRSRRLLTAGSLVRVQALEPSPTGLGTSACLALQSALRASFSASSPGARGATSRRYSSAARICSTAACTSRRTSSASSRSTR